MQTRATFFYIIWLTVGIRAVAQPCVLEDLLKQPGNWLAGRPNPTNYVAPADLARQKTIINNIVLPVQKKYAPRGIDVEINSAFIERTRLPEQIKSGNYYTIDFTFVKHDCPYDRKKIMTKLGEAWGIYPVRIHINDFAFVFGQSFFVATASNQEHPGTDAFALVNELPVNEGNAWYWKNGGGRNNANDHLWLITIDGKLPFDYIPKKEFAERYKEYCKKKIKAAEIDYSNNMKTAEATFQQIKTINATEANKFKEQSEVQYKKQLEIEKSQYAKNISVIDEILQNSDAKTLQEPAVVDRVKGYYDFLGFVDVNHDYASWAIKPNPAYFNSKLPKSSPQFIVLYCDVRDEPVFRMAREELLKAIDFAALKGMLGK